MKILGIDPGKAAVGWGVVERDKRQELKYIDCGVIKTSSSLEDAQRFRIIFNEMNSLLRRYEPDALAVEKLYFFKNRKTAIGVAQAKGVILLTGARKKIPVYEYTPLQIKTTVAGYGRAKKMQVQKMIKELLKMEKRPKPNDAADGLGVAITCFRSTKTKRNQK